MKQVCHNKGSTIDQHGARQRTAPFEDFYEYDGIKLKQFPVPEDRPLDIARELDFLAQERTKLLPVSLVGQGVPSVSSLRTARTRAREVREQMIALQEDLDWRCYRLYGVMEDDRAHSRFPGHALTPTGVMAIRCKQFHLPDL